MPLVAGHQEVALAPTTSDIERVAGRREFCEDRAFIRAVISLPQETFYSAGASVKASLLFMQKFSEEEAADYQGKRRAAAVEVEAKYRPEIEAESIRIQRRIDEAAENIKSAKPPTQAARKKMSKHWHQSSKSRFLVV